MSVTPLAQRQEPSVDLADAAGRGEHVFLFCLSCARSLKASARTALGVFGAIPFGMLVGKRACSRCSETLWLVLPWWAPTPRDWVKAYRPESVIETPPPPLDGYVFQVWKCWRGNPAEQVLSTRSLPLAEIGFRFYADALGKSGDEHIELKHGILLLRDSRRDLRVVE